MNLKPSFVGCEVAESLESAVRECGQLQRGLGNRLHVQKAILALLLRDANGANGAKK